MSSVETIIVTLLVVILLALALSLIVLARVAMVATQARDAAAKGSGNNGALELTALTALLKTVESTLAEVLREFKPADGASLSYRINSLVTASLEEAKNAVWTRASQQEAVMAVRSAQESVGRIALGLATVLEKLDALAIAQARQAQEQSKIVNSILVPGHDSNTIAVSGAAGQVSAGHAVKQAQQGVDITKEGVETIQQGIDQLKDGAT